MSAPVSPPVRSYGLEARTDIWTGDAQRGGSRLILTGLLGSVRWWFEVLVRGLGGAPCDPSAQSKPCRGSDHCVVCELFGCTGWARKFRFDVRDAESRIVQRQLTRDTSFQLRFTSLRAVQDEEWDLLALTIRLIAEYGALGGRTVLKHADYGIVTWTDPRSPSPSRKELQTYVQGWPKRHVEHADWASCRHMWFVERSLTRSAYNRVLATDGWLAGSRGESKKVFSFRSPPRSFGFVERTADLDAMRDTLRGVCTVPPSDEWFVAGDALLDRLFDVAEVER